MNTTKNWGVLATEESINKTIAALKANGMDAVVVADAAATKAKVIELIPKGAEIMNQTSVTLETVGLAKEINESGNYDSVRNKLNAMDRKTQGAAMQKLGAAPEWVIGSVHSVTENGEVFIASNTGSQLSSYAYGSSHVIWVVGTQKIVKDADEATHRMFEHSLELEHVRANKAYGVPGSAINKILKINKEVKPGRITIIFVKEVLGF